MMEKYEYLEDRIKREDAEQLRLYLESIGPIGRIFDSHIGFCIIMMVLPPLGWVIGLLIGFML